ncbi:hypothetical protein [Pseudoalteromonas sp.]|uniref:hypothetical protein n=1 Tax=Pseudoalteromonas sp. TaxID=53249 RepID=UPI00261DF803|nr:hypothetical protein [Pseudoalteromonas sp.]MCP4585316.1 hypothetical protein [Pseudoalteromonas sp.]
MRRFVYALFFLSISLTLVYGTTMQSKTNDTSPAGTDIIWTTKDPTGTPLDRKLTLSNLDTYIETAMDGENISDDTIDDDSIDWSDVTAADITFAEGDITDSTIVSADIKDDTIESADYAAGSIDAEHLAADIIDETKIADNGIDSEHYNDGSIDAIHLVADIIDETKLADNSIDSEHYNDASIDNAHLADNAVDSAEINTNAVKLDALDVSDVSDDIAGDIAEGELANAIIVDADIKDDTIQEPALNCTNGPQDNYILSYNSGGTNFTWIENTGGGSVSVSGTPTDGQIAVWTNATTIEGLSQIDVQFGESIEFEGDTGDAHEAQIVVVEPTADGSHLIRDTQTTDYFILSGDTFTGDVTATLDTDGSTALTIANDAVETAMINTDAVTMDGIDADGTFTSLTGAWETTGTLKGAISVTSDTTATIALTASNCLGGMRVNGDNDVIDYTLPTAAAGLNVLIYSPYAQVVTIDTENASDNIVLDGATLTNGNAIDSPGTAGDFVSLLGIDNTSWVVLGKAGTWVDGGAD